MVSPSTLRSIIKQSGLTVEKFLALLESGTSWREELEYSSLTSGTEQSFRPFLS
jgi:hypothetical protein